MTSVETILTGINETEKEMKENDLEESLIYNLTDSNGNVNISELSSEEVHMIDFFFKLFFCKSNWNSVKMQPEIPFSNEKISFTLFFVISDFGKFRVGPIESQHNNGKGNQASILQRFCESTKILWGKY